MSWLIVFAFIFVASMLFALVGVLWDLDPTKYRWAILAAAVAMALFGMLGIWGERGQ